MRRFENTVNSQFFSSKKCNFKTLSTDGKLGEVAGDIKNQKPKTKNQHKSSIQLIRCNPRSQIDLKRHFFTPILRLKS